MIFWWMFFFAVGLFSIWAHVQFYQGKSQYLCEVYFKAWQPRFFRNLGFTLLPGGCFCLLFCGFLVLHLFMGLGTGIGLNIMFFTTMPVSIWMYWWSLTTPRRYMKPQWMLDREAGEQSTRYDA